ncbi:MAG: alpha-ketoacid dehydrogenase subunit beta [Candidatus Muiribacteriota bacterium]
MKQRVVSCLNNSLYELLNENEKILIIGEDIQEPYGGAFKVTKGLSDSFKGRIITTPISEAGITGLSIGLSMRGFIPITEIMFGDFITLISDQIINHASKIANLYDNKLPFVIRTPMGGRRGYGPTHSQSLEKLFLGIPGITVIAVSNFLDPGLLLKAAVNIGKPVIFIENKLLYSKFIERPDFISDDFIPTVSCQIGTNEPDVTIVAYGGMAQIAKEAAEKLYEKEDLSLDLIIPHQISPFNSDSILISLKKTRRLVVVEEGVEYFGWGAEVIASLSNVDFDAPPQRVGAKLEPIPAAEKLEEDILPQIEDIFSAVIKTVDTYLI